jgi:hypothetical protein
MKYIGILIIAASFITSGCRHADPMVADEFGGTNIVNLAAIRSDLTTDLTYKEARERFGEPWGPALVSGSIYPRWRLADGHILKTAFRLIAPHRLQWAIVQTKDGEVIEEILEDQRKRQQPPAGDVLKAAPEE